MWEVLKGKLWQGDLADMFTSGADVCVSCTLLSQLPTPFKMHLVFPFADCAELPDLELLQDAAEFVVDQVQAGREVLVNCNEGRNRSGLVIGYALKKLGYDHPVEVIRTAHPGALSNLVFAGFLESL